jgi:hypothetical protein
MIIARQGGINELYLAQSIHVAEVALVISSALDIPVTNIVSDRSFRKTFPQFMMQRGKNK